MDAVIAGAPAVLEAKLAVDVDGLAGVGDEQGEQDLAEQRIVGGVVLTPALLARRTPERGVIVGEGPAAAAAVTCRRTPGR
jgi:hypothetical protein